MHKPKDEEGYTEFQRAFCYNYVMYGEKEGTKAAVEAGYSENGARVRACELLKRPEILDLIAHYRRETYQRDAVIAKHRLMELIADPSTPASVTRQACVDIIDRAGDKHIEKVEVKEHLSADQIDENIKQLINTLAESGDVDLSKLIKETNEDTEIKEDKNTTH